MNNDTTDAMDDTDNPTTDGAIDGQIKEGQSLVPPLPEDNDTPFSPPTDLGDDPAAQLRGDDTTDDIDPTHQALDPASDIDSHELYDEGPSGAAEQSEPNADNAVQGYDPTTDQREQQ